MSNIPTISSIIGNNISGLLNPTDFIVKSSTSLTPQDKIIYTMTGTNLKNIIEIIYTPKNPNDPFISWNGPPHPVQNPISDSNNSDWSYENGDGTSIIFTIPPQIGGQYYISDSNNSDWSYENGDGTSIIFTIPPQIGGQYYVQVNSNGNFSYPYFYEFPLTTSGRSVTQPPLTTSGMFVPQPSSN